MGAFTRQRDILATIAKIRTDLSDVHGHEHECEHLEQALRDLASQLSQTEISFETMASQQKELEGLVVVFQELSMQHAGMDSFSTLSCESVNKDATKTMKDSNCDNVLPPQSDRTPRRSGATRKHQKDLVSPRKPRSSPPRWIKARENNQHTPATRTLNYSEPFIL